MKRFLEWFPARAIDPVLKAGVAHFWFVTIHPFADGNGRSGRAIAEPALAQADGTQERYYSMSFAIEAQRDQYARLAECSNDTALRDIGDLLARGIVFRNPGRGRSTSYRLAAAAPRRSVPARAPAGGEA